MAARNPTAPQPPNLLGRYEIIREIARSNDIVWEARDPRINRRVALKELNQDTSQSVAAQRDRTERFYREARAAGKLTHPNIVTILDVSEWNGRHYIAMEYLEGETLRRRLNTVGTGLPLHQVILIGVALCDALEYAHNAGVVHRDIKPDNVHILPGFDMAAAGAQGVVKLTDFGIARIQEETNLTVAGQVFGTPSYMSPEQIRGDEIDSRSDLFSLGVMLHECTTGKKPFPGDSIATITHGLMYNPTPPLVGVPVQLDDALRRVLMKSPQDRFQTAAQFRTALLAALQTRNLSPTGAPLIAPAPLPDNALPQRTMQYGSQTQMGVTPGFSQMPVQTAPAWNPNPNVQPPPDTNTPSVPRRSNIGQIFTRIFAVVVMVGLTYGIYVLFGNASRNYEAQTRYSRDNQTLAHAIKLYENKQYLEAVQIFEKLRAMKTSGDIVTKSTNGALFAYRELGHEAQNRGDWSNAIKWYRAALGVKPDDAAAKTEYDTALKFTESTRPADPLPPPGAPETTTQFPSRPAAGTSNETASDFVQQRDRKEQESNSLLQQANDARSRGNGDEEKRLLGKITEEYPGTKASDEVIRRLPNGQ